MEVRSSERLITNVHQEYKIWGQSGLISADHLPSLGPSDKEGSPTSRSVGRRDGMMGNTCELWFDVNVLV